MRSLHAIAAVRPVLRSGCGADLMRKCLQYTLYWRDLRSLHQQWCGYSCSPQSSEDKTLTLLCLIAEHARKELSCREAFFSETRLPFISFLETLAAPVLCPYVVPGLLAAYTGSPRGGAALPYGYYSQRKCVCGWRTKLRGVLKPEAHHPIEPYMRKPHKGHRH